MPPERGSGNGYMLRNLSLQYIAGLVDGEGHIGIHKSGTCARLVIGMSGYKVLKYLRDTYGGSITMRPKYKDYYKQIYVWDITGNKAIYIILSIRPWLIIKRKQADLIELCQAYKLNGWKEKIIELSDLIKNENSKGDE